MSLLISRAIIWPSGLNNQSWQIANLFSFVFFVRDGIHSDADYNSTRVGVVVVVVVRIFTWDNSNALSDQVDVLHGYLSWLCALNPNSGANFTHADRPDQPNLYFWEKISKWANLTISHPIWFIFGTEVIGKPLLRFRMFEVVATIFRPTSPTNQNRPKVKISNFCVFCPIWMKFGMGANNGTETT